MHSNKLDYMDHPVSTQDNTTGIHFYNVTISTKFCIISGTEVKARFNLHGSDMRSIFFLKRASWLVLLSNFSRPSYFMKEIKINLTGSNTGKLTMLKKNIKATGSLRRKKIIEIVQIGASMPNLV